MGQQYSSFAIRGIDVSEFNGVIDWRDIPAHFAAIRVGYGKSLDKKFTANWSQCKINKFAYWYMDYYSKNGLSDADWGKQQAENCYKYIGGNEIVFLDIESGHSSYSEPITTVTARAQAIAKAFLIRMDELNGKRNGIYCSLGLLSWFPAWFRDRPLWVAWYPFRKYEPTVADIVYMVKNNGWKVAPIIWQYASDGDVDDNGTSDGKTYFKTELKEMDLNGWVGTVKQYESMFSTSVPDPIETPDDEAEVIPVANTRVIEVKTATRTLTLRKKPQVSILTQIKLYPAGTKFDCLEKVTDSQGNVWQRVGIDQYIADYHNGITYLK